MVELELAVLIDLVERGRHGHERRRDTIRQPQGRRHRPNDALTEGAAPWPCRTIGRARDAAKLVPHDDGTGGKADHAGLVLHANRDRRGVGLVVRGRSFARLDADVIEDDDVRVALGLVLVVEQPVGGAVVVLVAMTEEKRVLKRVLRCASS